MEFSAQMPSVIRTLTRCVAATGRAVQTGFVNGLAQAVSVKGTRPTHKFPPIRSASDAFWADWEKLGDDTARAVTKATTGPTEIGTGAHVRPLLQPKKSGFMRASDGARAQECSAPSAYAGGARERKRRDISLEGREIGPERSLVQQESHQLSLGGTQRQRL